MGKDQPRSHFGDCCEYSRSPEAFHLGRGDRGEAGEDGGNDGGGELRRDGLTTCYNLLQLVTTCCKLLQLVTICNNLLQRWRRRATKRWTSKSHKSTQPTHNGDN